MDEDYSFTPDERLRQILDTILAKREGTQVDDPSAGKTIRYLFIDLRDADYGSDVSRIVELTYNSKLINDALRELIVFHVFVAIGALILSFGFAFIISRTLTKPIQEIVSDVDTIAKGNLDHKVRISIANEFVMMEQSINMMVEKLKASIDKLTESEAKLKKSEGQFRESEKKYKDLVGLLPQLVYEIDTQGKFTFVNRYAFDVLGYTPVNLEKGVTVSDVLIPEDRSRALENIHRILKGEKVEGSEYTILKKDGIQVKVMAYSTPIIDDGKVIGLRGVLVNITKLKQVEEEIRQLNEELERRVAERTVELEAASREMEAFTYSVSHDLRAPLRALDGYSSILLKESHQHLTENDKRYLELVRNNAQQMAQLIDDLLNFSRSGRVALNKEVVKPIFLVQKALDDLSEERKGRDVEIILHNLPRTYADPQMLQQVFNNLLSNALKFTRKQEHVKIEVGALERENQTIYYVRDNGVGFDMQYADKLFKVFQRFHSPQEYEGTGVGLAIVHRIIQRHGGTIWVESEVDKGASIYFTI